MSPNRSQSDPEVTPYSLLICCWFLVVRCWLLVIRRLFVACSLLFVAYVLLIPCYSLLIRLSKPETSVKLRFHDRVSKGWCTPFSDEVDPCGWPTPNLLQPRPTSSEYNFGCVLCNLKCLLWYWRFCNSFWIPKQPNTYFKIQGHVISETKKAPARKPGHRRPCVSPPKIQNCRFPKMFLPILVGGIWNQIN